MNADNMLQTTGNAFKSPFEDAASCDAAFFTLSDLVCADRPQESQPIRKQ